MLLMVPTSRHHGMPAPPDSKDGLQGAGFNLWTPDAKHRHHQPDTTHLDPNPLREPLAFAGDLCSWQCPSVDHVPFVNRPFEWEIDGSVNLTTFCGVLLVTWRHGVCFSCYLRQKVVARNVFKSDVLPCW